MTAKAPTLAWLLTALAAFLVGLALAEGRHRADALTAGAPVGLVVTVEVAYPPTAAPEPTDAPTPTPMPTLAPTGLYPDHSAADFPDSTPRPCDAGPAP